MEINSKKVLRFVLQADRMMNRGVFRCSLKDKIKHLFFPDIIMNYMVNMRKTSYYRHKISRTVVGGFYFILYGIHLRKHKRLGRKLGFTIGYDTLGYGCVIPHWGTIVVGNSNRLGKYPVLQTSTCISGNGKIIGDGLYLATGAKITSKIVLGNNISIGANSLVNKSYVENDALLGGVPAKFIKKSPAWYIRDGFEDEVIKIEQLRVRMGVL